MIISHKYKFIFIKTLKTAGTSIEVYLSQYCGADDVITPVEPPEQDHSPQNHTGFWNPLKDIRVANERWSRKKVISNFLSYRKYYNHIPAEFIKNRLNPKIWNSYYKFCVERNPWDKSLSYYNMLTSMGHNYQNFQEYLDNGPLCHNLRYYADQSDNVLVDRVLYYESLNEELEKLFGELGIPFNGQLSVRAKSDTRKVVGNYQSSFSELQAIQVSKLFKQEIDLHKYKFD